jgi:RimJ/RimL family protein N-acetyltransferase
MLKIGAVQEGVLRNNFINDDGSIRSSMYFSFIKEEWPETRDRIFKEFIAK